MKWNKRLAFMMVFVFILSWVNAPVVYGCIDPVFSVIYDGNGFTDGEVPIDNNNYFEGDSVIIAEQGSIAKLYHSFSGWNDKADGSGNSYSGTICMPDKNLTLYAQWIENEKYTVTYYGNGNTDGAPPIDESSPYYAGQTVSIEDSGNLTKENHTFGSWNTNMDGSGTSYYSGENFIMPENNTELYAQWIENGKFTVIYDGNGYTGGNPPVDSISPYYSGEYVNILNEGNMVRNNHSFISWNTKSDGEGTDYSPGDVMVMPEENIILFANWLEDPSYIVTYYGNSNDSGTAPIDSNSPYYEGEEVTVIGKNDLLKNHCSFANWNTNADGSGLTFYEGDKFYMGSNNVELYAQWNENPSYSVNYYGNGNDEGTAPSDTGSPYYEGETVIILGNENLVKNNHTFGGWNTSASGGGTQYLPGESFTMVDSNVDLFAQWIEDPAYNIIYFGNGNDSGEPPLDLNNPYYVDEAVIILGQNTMLREHYSFAGWNTGQGGDGESYSPGDAIAMISGGINLYAQWAPVLYTVTYHEGSYGVLSKSGVNSNLQFGEVTPEAPGVIPDYGYLFTVWDPSPSAYVDGNADYFAQYIPADDTLHLEKTPSYSGEEPLEIGDEVTYTFTITNNGNVLIKNIQLSDPEIIFNQEPEQFDLAPGNSVVFTDAGTYIIDEDDAIAGFFTNEARAEGTTDEFLEPTVAIGSATVLVKRAEPSLILQKDAWTDHTPAKVGDSVNYGFTITNNGNVTLYDVYVDDTYIGFTSTRVTLAPGAQHTWTLSDFYRIKEEDLFLDDIYNEATAYGWASMATQPVTYTDDATVVIEDAAPAINIDKSVNDNNVYVGETITFTMIITNTGNVTLYDVTLTDELLMVSETRSYLAPGDWFSVNGQYVTKTSDIPGFENLATAEGHVFNDEEVRAMDSDSVTVTVREIPPPVPPENWIPGIEVTITPDVNSVYIGENVVFTMVVSNKGNTVLNDVVISNEQLGFLEDIPILFVLGYETFTVTREMAKVGSFVFDVEAHGTSPQGKTVKDTASTTVIVQEILTPPVDPTPADPPENPETGAIPIDAYSVSGLIALGAGIFALLKRKKEAEDDEDYDM